MTEQPKIDIWDQIEVNVKDLKDFERNPRINTKEDYARLKASIVKFGYFTPIKATQDLRIMGGHLRRRVLTELGVKRIPIMVPKRQLTDDEFYEIVVRDNVSNGGWNFDMMGADCDVEKLIDWGIPENQLGIEKGKPEPGAADDVVPSVPKKPFTKRGDVWQLGAHRVMCGDSATKEDVDKLVGETEIGCILTDPPYCSGGFQEAGKSSGSIGTEQVKKGAKFEGGIANDKLSTRGYISLMKGVLGNVSAPMAYIFTDWRMWLYVVELAEPFGFGTRAMIVWDKQSSGMGSGWRAQHELVFFGSKITVPFDRHKSRGNVITCARQPNELHPTQKPVELLDTIIHTTDFVKTYYDPFGGSGSTIIACEKAEKACIAMEMSPEFVDVIVRRWQEFTGRKAVRLRDNAELPEK